MCSSLISFFFLFAIWTFIMLQLISGQLDLDLPILFGYNAGSVPSFWYLGGGMSVLSTRYVDAAFLRASSCMGEKKSDTKTIMKMQAPGLFPALTQTPDTWSFGCTLVITTRLSFCFGRRWKSFARNWQRQWQRRQRRHWRHLRGGAHVAYTQRWFMARPVGRQTVNSQH